MHGGRKRPSCSMFALGSANGAKQTMVAHKPHHQHGKSDTELNADEAGAKLWTLYKAYCIFTNRGPSSSPSPESGLSAEVRKFSRRKPFKTVTLGRLKHFRITFYGYFNQRKFSF